MQVKIVFWFVVSAVLLTGCMATAPQEPKFIEDIRPVAPVFKVTNFSIQRRDLQESLSRSGDNTIRLVPVYQNISVRQSYEYRLFDVRESSAYALLGLQSSDIIVAADKYLLKRPEQFSVFVQVLSGMDEASIEVRRDGEARLLKYRFLPALAPK